MNLLFAIVGGILGLFVTGAALYTAWMVYYLWQQQAASPRAVSRVDIAVKYFSRWTMMDYAAVALFVVGLLLLLAELFAALRDRAGTDVVNFHFSYLLSGIIFSTLGTVLLIVRLMIVLGFAQTGALHRTIAIAPNHEDEPDHANEAENRV
ncbi:hypothetical protein GCM10008018_11160 [Paenibacillus marchantiophytorum]|uniref:Transmembrane protein n=1 Tax=Paenibacillus marchantiophytorum TaxID=1619310 RepID=A0ABQ2BT71_9BACL|nr:hypothetical protein [Paenibacillus marchantiophytorum]GGI45254.1 hypothetical protein GCM10008018_11160 [Paenibacillus marchantiophytorum]